MKKTLLAPSRIQVAGLASLLCLSGLGAFSSNGQERPPAGTADASTETSPSSPSKKSSSSSSVPVFSSTVDQAKVSLGDRVVVTYSARIPAGATLSLDALVTPAPEEGKRPPGGAVLEFETAAAPSVTKSKTGDFFEWSQAVALFPFSAGQINVPGPHYLFEESSGRRVEVRPPAIELTVASRLPPDQKPEEIAPKTDKPIRVPGWPAKYFVALGLLVALVGGLVAWLVARKRRRAAPGEAGAPEIPPGDELRLALARLATVAQSLGSDPRAFYSDLTHAVKRFLERATGEPVLEWTTFETVRRLRERGFELPREAAFPDLLSGADRVKFGKGLATRDDARQALVRARIALESVEARLAARDAAAAAAAAAGKKAS